MSVDENLRKQITVLAAGANTHRVSGWTGAIAIVVAGDHWLTCVVELSTVHLTDEHDAVPTTLNVASFVALRRWLVDGVDYTHLVASGEFTIDGVYFDVLLLSKVLGLRPDRKLSMTP